MILCFQIKELCKGKYPILGKPGLRPAALIDAGRSTVCSCTVTLLTTVLKEHFIRGERFPQTAADLINEQDSRPVRV